MGLLRFMAACGIVFCVSCSIKEDRSVCPCVLKLDMTGIDTSAVKAADLFLYGPGNHFLSNALEIDDSDEVFEVSVPRGLIKVLMYSGTDGLQVGMDGMRIPYGEDSPPVYMHSSEVEAYGEEATEKVVLYKNHCVLTVRMHSDDDFPFRLDFKGQVDGCLGDGSPSRGEFLYSAFPDGDNCCEVVLPRQLDDSLVLELNDGTEVVKVFSLGKYIAVSGYDWTARNLQNITMELDFVLSRFIVEVQEWDEVIISEVFI